MSLQDKDCVFCLLQLEGVNIACVCDKQLFLDSRYCLLVLANTIR